MIVSLSYVVPAFRRMNFPVGTFERQLSFDHEKLRMWLRILFESDRIPLLFIQHRYDDWFAFSLGCFLFSIGFTIYNLPALRDKWNHVPMIFGSIGFLGGILDLVENRIFLYMADHISDFANELAIIFSIVNAIKWLCYAISIFSLSFLISQFIFKKN
jgi:lipid-A-disaccharide synthase-like uncharacterized protein